jgi:hypothetical protein
MSRISNLSNVAVAFPPAETETIAKQLSGAKSPLFQIADQNKTAILTLPLDLKPLSNDPLPGGFFPLGSLGSAVGDAAPSGPSGHIPEFGPNGDEMPFYDQGNSQGCGTTSLSMILKYYGIDISREDIDNAIRRTDSKLGSNPGDLMEFARDHGLEAEGYNNASWEDLKSMVDKGYPCMASIGNGDGGRHLIVVTGYETGADGKVHVLYHDPEQGDENGVKGHEQSMTLDDFKSAWGQDDFGLKNYFMAFAPGGTDLPAGNDKGAEGALGTHAGAENVVNGWDRIFSPECFGTFLHGIPQFFGGLVQTVGCGVGALFQKGASWLSDKVEGIPVLENVVQPFTDLVSGAGAAIADVFNGFGEAADSVGSAFESLSHGDFGGFVDGVGDAVGNVVSGAADAVSDAIDSVGDAISDVFSGW